MNPNQTKINTPFAKRLTKFKLKFQNSLNNIPIPEYALFSIYAIFTGAIVGLAAVLFHESILLVTEISFSSFPPYLYIVVPAIGMLILSNNDLRCTRYCQEKRCF